ncbi:MAG TPA: hypothetical protein VFS24_08180 [Steroidobacteraceae bacterium]|nr:hypothetical protein [Steroidobacteraceae bacterium]
MREGAMREGAKEESSQADYVGKKAIGKRALRAGKNRKERVAEMKSMFFRSP